jgi:hypothetical protein
MVEVEGYAVLTFDVPAYPQTHCKPTLVLSGEALAKSRA